MPNRNVVATATSPISEAYSWLQTVGHPDTLELIDVAQAVPGYPPPDSLLDHLRATDLDPLTRYGSVLGEPGLREALATDISKAYEAPVATEQVAITAGANQAFCLATLALCAPGDEVIVPVPYYFNHDMWLNINGIHSVALPCGDDMLPDPTDAAELLTERTRAIVLITPNNPTGQAYPPDLIAAFARLASANGIYLIVDETYRSFRPVTTPPHDLFSDPCWDESLIHLHSFSKVFSITGLRVGGLAASTDLLVEIDKLADCLTICPSRVGQEAAEFGLAHLGDWVEENRRTMTRRVTQFETLMEESPTPFEVASAGAYFAYVRHPFEGEAATPVARRLLAQQGVLALAGEMFGTKQHRYLRLAFANLDEELIPELVRRINALEE